MANVLLCDTGLAPDGCVVTIEDAGANGSAGTYVHRDIDFGVDLPQPALWVHTMTIHECDLVGRLVHVRVLAGLDTLGLGELAFDGQLTVPSGIIAVGDERDPGRQLLCGSPSTVDGRQWTSASTSTRTSTPSVSTTRLASTPRPAPAKSPCCCTAIRVSPTPPTADPAMARTYHHHDSIRCRPTGSSRHVRLPTRSRHTHVACT